MIVCYLVTSCKQLYSPPAISSSRSYLVVEGVINNGNDSTIINLSSSVSIFSKISTKPMNNAIIEIQDNQNKSYPLVEISSGKYVSMNLKLDSLNEYRLSIKTEDNKQYFSDYVPILNSPPIDTVYYQINNNGLSILSGTHDPSNKVKYYRWDYQETWIFHTNYFSGYVSNGDTVIERSLPDNEVYQCWGNNTSSSVLLGSTVNLSKSLIIDNPITTVTSTSEKLGSKYSIKVRQYALTEDEYKFWNNLKTNTEKLGSIFDAQPSQIRGNIHSVSDPNEPVLGYISAGKVSAKRIFISKQQLPNWIPIPYYPNCTIDSLFLEFKPAGATVPTNQENQYFNSQRGAGTNPLIPVQAIIFIPTIGPEIIIGHTGSTAECVDCTLRGTNKKPSFWQ